MSSKRAILFDIDGTILSTPVTEEGERLRYVESILDVVGKEPHVVPSRFAGMVDPQICRILLTELGLTEEDVNSALPRVLTRMGEVYCKMPKKLALNPGVRELLEILKTTQGHITGVLTGNLAVVAEEKLRDTGIRSYFSVLFCADRYFDRTNLVTDALRTCVARYGLSAENDVVIIGDTPRDIEAANNAHATSVGVASGIYTVAQLKAAKPAHAYPSLEPTTELLSALGIASRTTCDG